MKKVSVYCKSGMKSADSYYRFLQYFNLIDCKKHYHKMIPDSFYDVIMPIGPKNVIYKFIIYIFFLIRVTFQLVSDYLWSPDFVFVSRRFINKKMPFYFRFILDQMAKKTKIIWDFDDNIRDSGEISVCDFQYLSNISTMIIVASPFLLELVDEKNRSKVTILETTDGDVYSSINRYILDEREKSYKDEIRLLWLGTFSSVKYVESIIPQLDGLSAYLASLNKKTILNFICDKPLRVSTKSLVVNNIRWTHNDAIEGLLKSHIGLMPLEDNLFTRGKGGFKLIQYLGAAMPIVGSSVGINDIIIDENVGFKIDDLNSEAWCNSLVYLSTDIQRYKRFSYSAYDKYNSKYSYQKVLDFYCSLINKM